LRQRSPAYYLVFLAPQAFPAKTSVQKRKKGGFGMIDDEVEDVARAIYASEYDSRGWEQEPELLKERFLKEARLAIAALDRLRHLTASREPRRLVG
jgi:hypothetical protein